MHTLRFDAEILRKRPPSGLDVETTLVHFAIVTYMVEPDALRRHVHERFELDSILGPDGGRKALLSVVPFFDRDFRFVHCPWPKWAFGQTNYRAYVTDSETGEHVVWFFGTALASLSVAMPRFAWKLPWHYARMTFSTRYDAAQRRYTEYHMITESGWAPAELVLEDSGRPVERLSGFRDFEEGMVILTHPRRGYFYRRDGMLGTYSIWHDRLVMTEGRALTAKFPLLDTLGLVHTGDLGGIHSVLIQPETDFTIYLPPVAVT